MPTPINPSRSSNSFHQTERFDRAQQGQAFDRKISSTLSVKKQLNVTASSHSPADRNLSTRSVRPASTSETASIVGHEPVAGRGKVKLLGNGCIEKQMAKWEAVNYTRIFQDSCNSELAEFFPADINWQLKSGKEVSLRNLLLSSPEYALLKNSGDAGEFSVEMTNVAPSGKVLDIKLGDIISTTADKAHGKNTIKRNLKRGWHILKQNTNTSGVTIQNHKGGIKREIDELHRESQFLPLLAERTGFGACSAEEQKNAATKLVTDLEDLKIAVKNSQVGFVGASILVSCDNGEPKINLIDVENCVLPGDPGVDSTGIEKKKDSFIRGLSTLQQQIATAYF